MAPFSHLSSGVRLTEERGNIVLENEHLLVRVEMTTGRIVELVYDKVSLLDPNKRKSHGGYWNISQQGMDRKPSIDILEDPANNGGERAVLSVKFIYQVGSSGLPLDIDLRFALLSGQSSLYTYAVLRHRSEYPKLDIRLGRFVLKLSGELFDVLMVDSKRQSSMPSGLDWAKGVPTNSKEARLLKSGAYAGKVEHKYDYAAVLFDCPAYGWYSRKQKVGVWVINPSYEYISGGPTKVELTGHLDASPLGRPTLLNVWNGPHYAATTISVEAGESWTKTIGPFLIHCNSGAEQSVLWDKAHDQAATERAKWPYPWAIDSDDFSKNERSAVSGLIRVDDIAAPDGGFSNLLVGLTAPYPNSGGRDFKQDYLDWQLDGKFYQYWTRASPKGEFSIENVRPGDYTLRAFCDGICGEFALPGIDVGRGALVELGGINWKPETVGQLVWQIGTPDRTARKFRHGDHYWQWGLYNLYQQEFPTDVVFSIGKSDCRRDWNYAQPPRLENGEVSSSTWTIVFSLEKSPPEGRAYLRLAIAGARAPRGIKVEVNRQPIRGTGPLRDSGVMHRDGIRGYWCQRTLVFGTQRLNAGENRISLTIPATSWTHGVLYDCVRLDIEPRLRADRLVEVQPERI